MISPNWLTAIYFDITKYSLEKNLLVIIIVSKMKSKENLKSDC